MSRPEILTFRNSASRPWSYRSLDEEQRRIAARVRVGGPGALLLAEVAPVITKGRRTPEGDLLVNPAEFQRRGIEVLETDRGGYATYHGPGQWVVFAVDSLERLTGDSRGVRKAVCAMLELAQSVAIEFKVQAEIRQGAELGLWTPGGKLAALGIHIEDRVLLHGLSFNVRQDETSFWGINPCGLKQPVAYLENELQTPVDSLFEQVGEAFQNKALARFWSN